MTKIGAEYKNKKLLRMGLLILLILIFSVISTVTLSTIIHMQGNARVINYAGIVRGATQRLVKQEISRQPNDELIQYLDGIVTELSTGEGNFELIALPDSGFQEQISNMRQTWNEIKSEINQVRQNGDQEHLYALSETYFDMADQAVSTAELYSEARVNRAKAVLLGLNGCFVILVLLFWLYGYRQKKIQRALDIAENASRAKGEFLSRMSHEIRTPMNGIIGMTAIAGTCTDDKEKLTNCLHKIDISSKYLMALINDILDMSRIESGKIQLEKEPFDLVDVFEYIYEMFKERAVENEIELIVKHDHLSETILMGDKLRITQVLVNLLSNALKFTPAGGQIRVDAKAKEIREDTVSLDLVVADTGIGMSEEFLSRIFEPFEQEQAATARQYGGTGLGLAISYNFVKMMDGEITVQSELNKGSQFTVSLTLPLPAEEELSMIKETAAAQSEQHGFTDLTDIHVLLAEDNEINAEIVTTLLENNGAKIEQAHNGKEALDKFTASAEGEYNLILMDVQMPIMDGLEATRAIRALERSDAKTTVIMGLSASAFREDLDKALKSGMDGYLAKPIDLNEFFKIMNSMDHA